MNIVADVNVHFASIVIDVAVEVLIQSQPIDPSSYCCSVSFISRFVVFNTVTPNTITIAPVVTLVLLLQQPTRTNATYTI